MEGYMAEIRGFAGNFAPRNWALCSGQLLPISSNSALFSLLGTTYGGDGRTTFGLPDLRGRVPIHEGTGPGLTPRNLGARSGSETNVLTYSQLPVHNHLATATLAGVPVPVTMNGLANLEILTNSAQGTEDSPSGNYLAAGPTVGKTPITPYSTTQNNTKMAAQSAAVSVQGTVDLSQVQAHVTVNNAGNSSAVNNMQPWLAINFIICMQGIYPSRN